MLTVAYEIPRKRVPLAILHRGLARLGLGAPALSFPEAGVCRALVRVPERPECYLALLNLLTAIDVWALRTGRYPSLYSGAVRYEREPKGSEVWQSIPILFRHGIGDCEDLACACAAEYRVRRGVKARPWLSFKRKPGGGRLFHVVTRLPGGRIEDPSKRLGM